ncbi:hypothetical protein CWO04_10885 [Vibrio splendidus]|nr:hypothetical protein BCU77_19605 [Vibrio splendidus]PTP86182.1 hypothetical protein CWO04_10885 [Vibrio splendidus]
MRDSNVLEESYVFRKSWTAYIDPVLTLVILCAIVYNFPLIFRLFPQDYYGFILIVVVPFLAVYIFRIILKIFNIRSVKIYINESGVWCYSGIFPWSRGTYGLRWCNFEQAVYYQNFFNWLFKSYTIKISQRFTQSSEIVLSHMRHGDVVTATINKYQNNILHDSNDVR